MNGLSNGGVRDRGDPGRGVRAAGRSCGDSRNPERSRSASRWTETKREGLSWRSPGRRSTGSAGLIGHRPEAPGAEPGRWSSGRVRAGQRRDDVIAIHTRSGMQVLLKLSATVSVPEDHLREGRAFPAPPAPRPARTPCRPSFASPTGSFRPTMPSRPSATGSLVWIENRDLRSKGVFTFLLILMTLADTGEKAPAPVLTIPPTESARGGLRLEPLHELAHLEVAARGRRAAAHRRAPGVARPARA